MARKLILLPLLLIAGCGGHAEPSSTPAPERPVLCWISEPGGDWQPDSCDAFGGYELVWCEEHPEDCYYRDDGLAPAA